MKLIKIIFFLLLTSTLCFAETNYKTLTPGKSTRAEVDLVLGKPVKEHSVTLVEYRPDMNKQSKIYVQYRKGSQVIERIEILLNSLRNRAEIINLLQLSDQSTKTRINANGNLEEYFGSPNYVVLTYQGPTTEKGVIRSGRYSRELFESAVTSIPKTQMKQAQSCFSAAPTIGNTSPNFFSDWAKLQTSATIEKHLKYKLALLFRCNSLTDDQLAKAFAEISVVVAKYAPNAKCFKNDNNVISTDTAAHYKWARSKNREQMLNNLTWKVSSAMLCTDRQNDFFTDISLIVAKSGKLQ